MEVSWGTTAIDIFFLLLCLGIVYSAVSRGIVHEFFKLTGLLFAIFFAFHYYPLLGKSLENRVSVVNANYAQAVSFLVIFAGITIVFNLARLIVTFLFRREHIALAERWLSLCTGLIRAALTISVLFFLAHLAGHGSDRLPRTISYKVFKTVAPHAYLALYTVYSKFGPQATVNDAVQKYSTPAITQ